MGKTYKIAVIGGDGTGPEVVREGIKVLDASAAKHDFKLDWTDFDYGGDRYLKTGEVLRHKTNEKKPAIPFADIQMKIYQRGGLFKIE